jgi:hypothetical protein
MFDLFGNLHNAGYYGSSDRALPIASAGYQTSSQSIAGAQNAAHVNNYHAQQAAAFNQLAQRQTYNTWVPSVKQYMINGKSMDFQEFIDTLYPEDCAEKTYLILKLSGEEK